MDRVLLIAFGNPLRGDDGIAWRVAEEIRRTMPGMAVLCVHQLTPELAEDASRAGRVIFIDAARNGEPGEIRCHTVPPDDRSLNFSHSLAPSQVLTICKQLYGAEPRGLLVSITGECFAHGEALSPRVIDALSQTVTMIKKLSGC
jgi:hydrogenase maturation protease